MPYLHQTAHSDQNISRSRPSPFMATLRHQSRGILLGIWHFLSVVLWNRASLYLFMILNIFESKHIWITTLTYVTAWYHRCHFLYVLYLNWVCISSLFQDNGPQTSFIVHLTVRFAIVISYIGYSGPLQPKLAVWMISRYSAPKTPSHIHTHAHTHTHTVQVIFTAWRYAWHSHRKSVRVSIYPRICHTRALCCAHTVWPTSVISSPYGSPMIPVFWCQISSNGMSFKFKVKYKLGRRKCGF